MKKDSDNEAGHTLDGVPLNPSGDYYGALITCLLLMIIALIAIISLISSR